MANVSFEPMEGLFLFGALTGAFFWGGLIFVGLLDLALMAMYISGRNSDYIGFWPVFWMVVVSGIGLHVTGIPVFPWVATQWGVYLIVGLVYGLVFRAAWSGIKSAREFRKEVAEKRDRFFEKGGTEEAWAAEKVTLITAQKKRGMSYYGGILFTTVILWPFDVIYIVFGEVLVDFVDALWRFARNFLGNLYEAILKAFTKDL
jgi:hypothetical protein